MTEDEKEEVIFEFLQRCSGDWIYIISNMLDDLSMSPEQFKRKMIDLIRTINTDNCE